MSADEQSSYLNAVVVVGLVFVDATGGERHQQYAGTIDRFTGEGEGEDAAVVLICHDGVERAFPWDPDALSEVEPGNYRLNEDGTVIRDPDYIMQFVVHDDSE